MSHAFLSSRCVKILICSSSDRLDKELMIAHMQVRALNLSFFKISEHIRRYLSDKLLEICLDDRLLSLSFFSATQAGL